MSQKHLRKLLAIHLHRTFAGTQAIFTEIYMAVPDLKPASPIPPAAPAARESESHRVKPTGTRLTEAEFAEVEAAAARAGKKVAEWLRDAALAQARSVPAQNTDPILLAELMAIRTLILNLFAAASKGPLTDESLRKMLAYADSVKQQKADEFLVKLGLKNGSKPSEEVP
jgi:hypothetical protein